MISPKTLDLFPFIRHYPIEEVLDWDLYGGSKLRWMLTDIAWDELHEEMDEAGLADDWDEVDELGGERFLTSIRLVGSNLEVTIYDNEAQGKERFTLEVLDTLLGLQGKGLVEYTDDEEHLIDEP